MCFPRASMRTNWPACTGDVWNLWNRCLTGHPSVPPTKHYSGTEMECDEQIFPCTLNLVFALPTQLQESIPSDQRDGASRTLFERAWRLLRPDIVLWQAGSVEVVQCLLLITRYLQCTTNLQQTWMTLGSAVRIALRIGLDWDGDRLTRDVWQQCVSMDRNLSWSLGRPSTIPITPLPSLDSLRNDRNPPDLDGETVARVSEKMHVLTKIAGYISLSQVPASSSLPERLGLIGPTTHVEPSAVMRIDEYLTALVSSLPAIPSFNAAGYETAHLFDRRSLLHRRLAHTRILLLRPMMACFAYRIYKRRKKLSRQPKRA